MNVDGKHFRTIWLKDNNTVSIIDQRHLPHKFITEDLTTVDQTAQAIKEMHVRGAGLIGATAGYGMYLASLQFSHEESVETYQSRLRNAGDLLKQSRPTAVNLEWAVHRQLDAFSNKNSVADIISTAKQTAENIANEDADHCQNIGQHGLAIIEKLSAEKNGDVVNILTHCNAGWLAFVDYGSATAPIYAAFDKGIKIHIWVDETRPRNQGARLTAWELGQHGISHTIIADNTGGHLMQHGLVDLVIVGTDRTTYTGDVANKIGTYLKALAAFDNQVPFYTALPSSSFDWKIKSGLTEIPIEQRDATEVTYIQGQHEDEIKSVLLTPTESPAANYAFDVTPARLVTGLITERGICKANKTEILRMFPEKLTEFNS